MLSRLTNRSVACLAVLWAVASPVFAQDSGALISALIRKGILTNQEAEDIRADLMRESNTVPAHAIAGGKVTDRLSVGMRLQMQYANLSTDIAGTTADPAPTNHFFLRRMYLTFKAGVGGDWSTFFTYDFAGGRYDNATIDWTPSTDLAFNFGLRKVNVVHEERGSSANLRALERSTATRYFTEPANGRRLGAGSYRIGIFVDGKRALNDTTNLVYSAALTTPERNEVFTAASFAGDAASNQLALWGNLGIAGKLSNGTWIAGVATGHLPDQGGFGLANLGRGYDLDIYTTYLEVAAGRFHFMTEYHTANVERGRAFGTDTAKPVGFYFQPSFLVTERIEAVVRYSRLNTDGRGVNLSDVLRSSPSGGIMNHLTEWYAGGNLYLRGNDLKYQLGLVYGKTTETVTGAPAEAKTVGVRSQLQLQF